MTPAQVVDTFRPLQSSQNYSTRKIPTTKLFSFLGSNHLPSIIMRCFHHVSYTTYSKGSRTARSSCRCVSASLEVGLARSGRTEAHRMTSSQRQFCQRCLGMSAGQNKSDIKIELLHHCHKIRFVMKSPGLVMTDRATILGKNKMALQYHMNGYIHPMSRRLL